MDCKGLGGLRSHCEHPDETMNRILATDFPSLQKYLMGVQVEMTKESKVSKWSRLHVLTTHETIQFLVECPETLSRALVLVGFHHESGQSGDFPRLSFQSQSTSGSSHVETPRDYYTELCENLFTDSLLIIDTDELVDG